MRRLALLLPLLALTACDSGDESFRVRLEPGTTITYRSEVAEVRAGAPDSVIVSGTLTQRVVADGQTVAGQRDLVEVLVSGTGPFSGVTRLWYRTGDRRLEEVAYAFGAMVGPVATLKAAPGDPTLPPGVRRRLGEAARGAGGDSVVVRTPPRIVAQYPLVAGRTWAHFATEDTDLRSTRTVLGLESVATPEGDRACWQIRTVLFFGEDPLTNIDWLDCLDEDGLVARTIRYLDIPVTGPTGEPTGRTMTQVERTVRTSVTR